MQAYPPEEIRQILLSWQEEISYRLKWTDGTCCRCNDNSGNKHHPECTFAKKSPVKKVKIDVHARLQQYYMARDTRKHKLLKTDLY
jgi:hypothetical protein